MRRRRDRRLQAGGDAMLTIAKPAPNRIDIELSGSVDTETMRNGLKDLMEKAEGVEHGHMLYRIPHFAMPSFGAVAVELGHIPRLLSLLRRFDRCAVMTDSEWLRRAAEVQGKLLPGLDVKGFALDDGAGAEAWLREGETAAV
jgi:hypothetical protein